MILGIDLDGCAFPFVHNFTKYLDSLGYNIPEGYEATSWDFYTDFGLNIETFWEIIDQGIREEQVFYAKRGYGDLPVAGFSNVINSFRRRGHQIHIITHRNQTGASNATLKWIHKYNIPYDALHFVKDKTIVKVDLLIEDAPENYTASIEAGIPCVLFRTKYNNHLNATFVESWHDVRNLINNVNEGMLIWESTRYHQPIFSLFTPIDRSEV